MRPEQRYAGAPGRATCYGGSLGARLLRERAACVALMPPICGRGWFISAVQTLESVSALYRQVGVDAEVVASSMTCPIDTRRQTLVVRAGAITVSELTVAGVARVMVPLVVSTLRISAQMPISGSPRRCDHLPQTEIKRAKLADLLRSLRATGC